MTTDQHREWEGLDVRTPNDVPHPTPLAWITEKHTAHADRLMNLALDEERFPDAPRGTAEDALAVLALRERLRLDMTSGRGPRIAQAAELGATWEQIGRALGLAPGDARELLRAWADQQRGLYLDDVGDGRAHPLGLDADRHAAVLALVDRDDRDGGAS